LRYEFVGIEQRTRHSGKESSSANATRIMTDIRDYSRLIAAQLRVGFCREFLDSYWFVHRYRF
jgi:hypothetical protein